MDIGQYVSTTKTFMPLTRQRCLFRLLLLNLAFMTLTHLSSSCFCIVVTLGENSLFLSNISSLWLYSLYLCSTASDCDR